MQNGARPTRIKHTDYDFIKSHNFGAIGVPQFQNEFLADAGLWMPNQDIPQSFAPTGQPSFSVPALPFGCTDYTNASIVIDLTKTLHNPLDLENITHANANRGCDIRVSLDAAKSIGWFKQYFNLIAKGSLDYFDTFRVAQVMGVDVGENRSVTWGTPWFPSWEKTAQEGVAIMPMPTDDEIKNAYNLPWHDSKLDGWTTRNGVLVYRDESLQGTTVGENGYIFFPREVINRVMGIKGTVAFTATNVPVDAPQTIDISRLQWLFSVLQTIIAKYI